MNKKIILGITAFIHDSSACLIMEDTLVAFAEEERFNYEKHSGKFPIKAIAFCLDIVSIEINQITDIAFYFNPKECLKRYIKTNINIFKHFDSFRRGRFLYEGIWLINFYQNVQTILKILNTRAKIHFVNHHLSHVWYGIYTSKTRNGIVLSNDSVGENECTLAVKFITKSNGEIDQEIKLRQFDPNSLGYLYGAVTEFLGFKRGDGEGKVMALASYGSEKFYNYFEKSCQLLRDGRFKIDTDLLLTRSFKPKGQRLSDSFMKKFSHLGEINAPFNQFHFDISYALQKVFEKLLDHQVKYLSTFSSNLILTGGIAQNSVANGFLSNKYIDMNIFIPPIPHDAGCSIGAAAKVYYSFYNKLPQKVETAFLGPRYDNGIVEKYLQNNKVRYTFLDNSKKFVLSALSNNKIIAFFRDRMEGGPRALCNRSIIANPGNLGMRDYLNRRVKFREEFRPYGGIMLENMVKEVLDYKNQIVSGPYMSFVFPVKEKWKNIIPSLVHIDGTCRVQIIEKESDSFLEDILNTFFQETGIPTLINTSLNIRGLPICCTVEDALSAYYCSGIDYLIFNENILLKK